MYIWIKCSLFQEQCETFCKALKKELPSSAFFVQPKVSLPPLASAREHVLLVCGVGVGWLGGGMVEFGSHCVWYVHAGSL